MLHSGWTDLNGDIFQTRLIQRQIISIHSHSSSKKSIREILLLFLLIIESLYTDHHPSEDFSFNLDLRAEHWTRYYYWRAPLKNCYFPNWTRKGFFEDTHCALTVRYCLSLFVKKVSWWTCSLTVGYDN